MAFKQTLGGSQAAFLAFDTLNRLAHQLHHHGTLVLVTKHLVE
jgi:hypothetical protein